MLTETLWFKTIINMFYFQFHSYFKRIIIIIHSKINMI